jgi:hypothetical protein
MRQYKQRSPLCILIKDKNTQKEIWRECEFNKTLLQFHLLIFIVDFHL